MKIRRAPRLADMRGLCIIIALAVCSACFFSSDEVARVRSPSGLTDAVLMESNGGGEQIHPLRRDSWSDCFCVARFRDRRPAGAEWRYALEPATIASVRLSSRCSLEQGRIFQTELSSDSSTRRSVSTGRCLPFHVHRDVRNGVVSIAKPVPERRIGLNGSGGIPRPAAKHMTSRNPQWHRCFPAPPGVRRLG